MASENHVSTIIRDDFFNDPFFKDWWGDFDLPLRNVQFSRQMSGKIGRITFEKGFNGKYLNVELNVITVMIIVTVLTF